MSHFGGENQDYDDIYEQPVQSLLFVLEAKLETRKEQCKALSQKILTAEETRKKIRALSFEFSFAAAEDFRKSKAAMKNLIRCCESPDKSRTQNLMDLRSKIDEVIARLRDHLCWIGEDVYKTHSFSKKMRSLLRSSPGDHVPASVTATATDSLEAEHQKMKSALELLFRPEHARALVADIFDLDNYEDEDNFNRGDNSRGNLGVVEKSLQQAIACLSVLECKKSFQHMKCAVLSLYRNLTSKLMSSIQETEFLAIKATKTVFNPMTEIYNSISDMERPYSALSMDGKVLVEPENITSPEKENVMINTSIEKGDPIEIGARKFQEWLDFKTLRNFAAISLDTLPVAEVNGKHDEPNV